ncbi:hypothetical protein [Bythopirellula goksoeyrii]|nr:hypothetical protein [Bythopirellula goksoeyrii]
MAVFEALPPNPTPAELIHFANVFRTEFGTGDPAVKKRIPWTTMSIPTPVLRLFALTARRIEASMQSGRSQDKHPHYYVHKGVPPWYPGFLGVEEWLAKSERSRRSTVRRRDKLRDARELSRASEEAVEMPNVLDISSIDDKCLLKSTLCALTRGESSEV